MEVTDGNAVSVPATMVATVSASFIGKDVDVLPVQATNMNKIRMVITSNNFFMVLSFLSWGETPNSLELEHDTSKNSTLSCWH